LWRRPRPKLGCGAKERRRRRKKLIKTHANLSRHGRYALVSKLVLQEYNCGVLPLSKLHQKPDFTKRASW
jgi:hypothetical protein